MEFNELCFNVTLYMFQYFLQFGYAIFNEVFNIYLYRTKNGDLADITIITLIIFRFGLDYECNDSV